MTKKTTKVHVVLGLPRSVPLVISLAQAIEAAISAASKTFPSPTPTMSQVSSDVATLVTAQNAAHLRTKGAVSTRDAQLAVVKAELVALRAYVQTVCDADPTNAATIAQAAGMTLRKASSHTKAPLTAKPAAKLGVIAVLAKLSSARQSNDWQLSTDGGKTWTDQPSTLQAKTTISGLTPGQTVSVRHRAVTKAGEDTWSDPVAVLVR